MYQGFMHHALCSHPKALKWFRKNVLDGTKREYYGTLFWKKVLDGTKSWSQ